MSSQRLDQHATTALLLRNLTEVFDERDADRRRTAIAELWAEDGIFVDPEGRFVGHVSIDTAIETLHDITPGHRFAPDGEPLVHEGGGLLNWSYGPDDDPSRITGQDIAVVADGKIVALYTYLDPPDPAEDEARAADSEELVRQTVETFFTSLAEGDLDRAMSLLTEDVDWLIPGDESLPWTGRRTRREEIPEVLAIISGLHVPGESEAETYMTVVDGPDAVRLGRIAHTVKSTGTRYSMLVAFHLTVAADRITRLHMYEDTFLVSRSVGAPDRESH